MDSPLLLLNFFAVQLQFFSVKKMRWTWPPEVYYGTHQGSQKFFIYLIKKLNFMREQLNDWMHNDFSPLSYSSIYASPLDIDFYLEYPIQGMLIW